MAPSQPQRKQRVRKAVPTIDDFGELAPSCDSRLTVAIQKNGMEKSCRHYSFKLPSNADAAVSQVSHSAA